MRVYSFERISKAMEGSVKEKGSLQHESWIFDVLLDSDEESNGLSSI